MAKPSEKTIKQLFALSGNQCAFPDCQLPIVEQEVVTGQICHIKANNPGGPRYDANQTKNERQSINNLILLCAHHHTIIDSKPDIYNVDVLHTMKNIHIEQASRSEQPSDIFYAMILLNHLNRSVITGNKNNVAIGSPGVIQGQVINIKDTRKVIKINPPSGTIGSDQRKSRYISYLIERYNKFAATNKDRTKNFNYGVISRNIESNFGAKWRILSLDKFGDVCRYLYGRIEKTIPGKRNKSKGVASYSNYEQYLKKYE